MRKKFLVMILVIIIFECIAVSGILAYFVLSSENQSPENVQADANDSIHNFAEEKFSENSTYNVVAEIEVHEATVSIKENLMFDKSSEKQLAYIPSANNTETHIKRVYSDKGIRSYSANNTMLQINCNGPQDNIKLEYEINLHDTEGILVYKNGIYYLTNFLITPAVYRNSNPVFTYKSSLGDPYIYGINNYYIMFKSDKALNIIAPGRKEEHIFGANKLTVFEASNMRDFPAVAFKNANSVNTSYNNINFTFINASEAKEYVKAAFEFAQKNIGPYPYKDFFVVKAPITQKGMEFSNMIFLNEKYFSDRENLKRLAYHEVLHQWFYGIIGTDQLNEPFMDEGMVTFLSLVLSDPAKVGDKLKYSGSSRFSSLQLDNYYSKEEYYRFAYNDSAAFFYTINKKLGNNFYKLLQRLYNEKKFKTLYFSDFMKYVNNY